MTYRDGWGLVVLTVLATACASQRGQLSGAWVVAGSPARAGVAQPPRNAQPLVLDGSDGCIPAVAFIDQFGNPCKEHETEGGASTDMSGALPMGANPTTSEVRWFCEGRSVVRLVLDRCPGADSFRVKEVAVWMGGKH
jgi:hypothetical protein